MRIGRACAGCLAFAAFLAAPSSRADGAPFPTIEQIVFSPADPNVVVAPATFGVLISRDRGTTWSFLCSDALGIFAAARSNFPKIQITAGGTLVAANTGPGSSIALNTSADLGCNWSCAGLPLVYASYDVALRPNAPHTTVALLAPDPDPDGGGVGAQLFENADDRGTWTSLGAPIDSGAQGVEVGLAPSDPRRLYVTATRGYGAARTASLFVSGNGGGTWTEHPIPMFDNSVEGSIGIAGVDPADANRVYLRSNTLPYTSSGVLALYVTADGGSSFMTLRSFAVSAQADVLFPLRPAFALSADGSKFYAGTLQDGLFVGTRGSTALRQTTPVGVSCLTTRGSELWACSEEYTSYKYGPEFVIGVTTDDGATFVPKMAQLGSIQGPIACSPNPGGTLACGASANASSCGQALQNFCIEEVPCLDAGPPDAAAQAGAGDASATGGLANPNPSPSGGCSAALGQPTGRAAAIALGSGVAFAVRRRRERRRPTRTIDSAR